MAEAGTRRRDDLLSRGDLARIVRQEMGRPGNLPRRPQSTFGVATVQNGDTIDHGMNRAPRSVSLMPTVAKRLASATAVGTNAITVSLHDDTGAAIAVAEPVYWRADG